MSHIASNKSTTNKYITMLWRKMPSLAKELMDSRLMFRGIPAIGGIQSSAAYRISKDKKKAAKQVDFINYHINLIKHARENGHDIAADGQILSDLDVLAEIQHYGGATCLVDFTTNFLIALFFASNEPNPDKPSHGLIHVLDLSRPPNDKFFLINDVRPNDRIEEILTKRNKNEDFSQPNQLRIWIWKPSKINNRIRRQDSIFLFSLSAIHDLGYSKIGEENVSSIKILVDKDDKQEIRNELDFLFGISAETIFDDMPGYAGEANRRVLPLNYETISTSRCLVSGLDCHKQKRYQTAIDHYSAAIACLGNIETKGCPLINREKCNHLQQEIRYNRGQSYFESGSTHSAYLDYIWIINNPDDPEYTYYKKSYRGIIWVLYSEGQYDECIRFCTKIKDAGLVGSDDERMINLSLIELSILTKSSGNFISYWKGEWENYNDKKGVNHKLLLITFIRIAKYVFESDKEFNSLISELPIGDEMFSDVIYTKKDHFVRWSSWTFTSLIKWIDNKSRIGEINSSMAFNVKLEINKFYQSQKKMQYDLLYSKEAFTESASSEKELQQKILESETIWLENNADLL